MGCFIGCFRGRDDHRRQSQKHLLPDSAVPKARVDHDQEGTPRNHLSSLFLAEDIPSKDVEAASSDSHRNMKDLKKEVKIGIHLYLTMKDCTPYLAMILVQLAYGGANVLMKVLLVKGLNQFVFMVYRHLLAFCVLSPIAYVLERKQRPPFSFSTMIKVFFLASLGTTVHLNLFFVGLSYTSATVASALGNVIPSFTFVLAVIFGMEKVKIRRIRSQAKVIGTMICIGGSLVFTFWKGGYVWRGLVRKPLIDIYGHQASAPVAQTTRHKDDWIKGSALILAAHISWSTWLVLQVTINKIYSAQLSLNALNCLFATVQSAFLALFFARDAKLWKLQWNMELLTILYSGTVLSGFVYYTQIWCINKKGPVFSAMFSPLVLVVVAIFSAIAFAEKLHLGSLIGTALILGGLYCFLWAKRGDEISTEQQEERKEVVDDQMDEISKNNHHPLTDPVPR